MPENLVRLADRSRQMRGSGFTTPAAKGFDRDAVVGRDVVSRAERQWTQPMTRKEMN